MGPTASRAEYRRNLLGVLLPGAELALLVHVLNLSLFGCIGSSVWGTGSRAWAQKLWLLGLLAPRHGGPSQIRIKPAAPALAGGFLTTGPRGKSLSFIHLFSRLLTVARTDIYFTLRFMIPKPHFVAQTAPAVAPGRSESCIPWTHPHRDAVSRTT